MEKALEVLKEIEEFYNLVLARELATRKPVRKKVDEDLQSIYNRLDEIREAIAELEKFKENMKSLTDGVVSNRQGFWEAMEQRTCEWKQCTSEYDTSLEGTCGVKWLLIDGTPTENHMKFCPQCGGKLIEIEPKDNA